MANGSDTSSMGDKLKRFFKHRYFLLTLLVVSLSLIIWFVGDAIAIYGYRPLEGSGVRLALVALVVLAFVGWEVFRWWRARKANEALLASISATDQESDARASEELRLLKERMEQAVELLKKQKFEGRHGKTQLINQLPWYIFIGAPGSGKTTALMNCGLKFPLAGREGPLAIKGIGGTRNCDWWFTNEAVFLDTAGRYTTQDSNQRADSKAWLGFLNLVKRFRSSLPINGAIITLSVSDLMSYDVAELKRYGDSVRARVHELYETLGVHFPIYVVVTKTDLLAGFQQFYSDMGAEERAQVWGCTFPYQGKGKPADGDLATKFDAEFARLQQSLYARVTDRVLKERDGEARALIYNFPQQFSAIGASVKQFIEFAFQSSRFDSEPIVRGVYFTSGTQEGAPIDRVLGSLSRTLGIEQRVLPPSAITGKSYFLKNVLQEVVFPEAGLVGYDENTERRYTRIMRAGFAVLGVVAVSLAAAWTVSYIGNRQLIAEARDKVAATAAEVAKISGDQSDLAGVLTALNRIRDLPYGYAERERGAPFRLGFGLFQGDKLGAYAVDSYRRVIGQTLLPRLAIELERQIRNPADDQVLYEALKAYLMLYDDKHLEPAALEAWVERLLPPGADSEARKDLVGHTKAALERRPLFIAYGKNDELIADARRRLAGASLADRAFGRLKLIGAAGGATPFVIADAAGPAASQVLARVSGEPLTAPFPAIFTRDGYYKSFKTNSEKLVKQLADEETWVLGKESGKLTQELSAMNSSKVIEEVRRRYFSEYAVAWDKLLLDLRLKRAANLSETILFARVLGGPDSPLKRLLAAVAKETTLVVKEEGKAGGVTNAVTEVVADATKRIVSTISAGAGQVTNAALTSGRAPELVVDEHFEKLRQLINAAPGAQPPIDQTLALLGEFSRELADVESKAAAGGVGVQGLPTAVRLKAESASMPPPVQAILRGLVDSSSSLTVAANEQALKSAMGGAASLCDKAVAGRYPFVKAAKSEVGIDDFNAVFKPGGDLDAFFKTNLQNLVDTSGATWKPREGSDKVAPVSAKTAQRFQAADAIRQAFFRGSPSANFVADLVYVSPEAGQAVFEYDGEINKLGPGQPNTIKLRWPGQRSTQPTRLYAGWGSGDSARIAYDGTWSLFRVMDLAASDGGRDKMRLTFDVEGKKLVFELRATSVFNPIRLRELQMFTCPGKE